MKHYLKEFDYFYKYLLYLVNTSFGRSLLKIQSKDRIVKISPNSYHILKGFKKGRPQLEATFFTSDRVAEKLLPVVSANRFYRHAFLTSEFTSNTGEGRIQSSNDVVWANVRGATSGGASMTEVAVYVATTYNIIRSFFPIDTSSLTSSAVISAATFKLYRDDAVYAFSNQDSQSVHVVQTSQASNTTLDGADYDNLTFTDGGSFTYASTSNGAYSTINLNATGLTWVNKSAHTNLGVIASADLNNSAPTVGTSLIGFQDNGDANPPTLTVTYTLTPSSGGGFLTQFLN